MATYLPNSQDYIPSLQPFHPDLNFYGSVLNQKQSAYDTNHKQLSGVYGNLLNSPMMRDDNIERRDEFFKKIDQDIKKVSGMDLSLQQNVDSAMQVFKPLYTDKYIANDMTKTKQFHGAQSRMESFKSCLDATKCGGTYGEEGARALQYWQEDFKNAGADEALSFAKPEYVPNQDVDGKAFKLAKDLNVKITKVTKEGKYLVTRTDGSALAAPLQDLFLNAFKNDGSIQAMYKMHAEVQRQDAAHSNAGHYAGGKDEAENAYLNTGQAALENSAKKELGKATDRGKSLKDQLAILDTKIKKFPKGIPETDPLALQAAAVREAIAQNDGIISHHEETIKLVDKKAFLGLDKNVIRSRIDGAVANSKFQADMSRAALAYSQLHGEESVKADPYELQASALKNSLILQHSAQSHAEKMLKLHEAKDIRIGILKGEIEDPTLSERAATESGNQLGQATSSAAYNEQKEFAALKSEQAHKFGEALDSHLKDVFSLYTNNIKKYSSNPKPYLDSFKKVFGVEYDPIKHKSLGDIVSSKDMTHMSNDADSVTAIDAKNHIINKDNFTDLLKKKAQRAEAEDNYNTVQQFGQKNNAAIFDYQLSKLPVEEKIAWANMFDKNKDIISEEEWTKKMVKTNPGFFVKSSMLTGTSLKNAHDEYKDLVDKFNSTYQGGYNKGKGTLSTEDVYKINMKTGKITNTGVEADVPLVESYLTHPGIAKMSEGLAARQMIKEASPHDKDMRDLFTPFLEGKGIAIAGSGGTDNQLGESLKSGNSPDSKTILQAALSDMYAGHKGKGYVNPILSYEYAGVAGNDPNKVQVIAHINPLWANNLKGGLTNPGLTANQAAWKNGITVLMNKSEVEGNQTWHNIVHQDMFTTKLNMRGSMTMSEYPDAGEITMKTTDHGYEVEGYVNTYHGIETFNAPVRSDISPKVAWDHYRKLLEAKTTENRHYHKVQKEATGGPIKSISDLNKVSAPQPANTGR